MNREKLILLILGILMTTFTIALDIYVYFELQALDYLAALTIVIVNILSIGLLYTIFLSFKNKQVGAAEHKNI